MNFSKNVRGGLGMERAGQKFPWKVQRLRKGASSMAPFRVLQSVVNCFSVIHHYRAILDVNRVIFLQHIIEVGNIILADVANENLQCFEGNVKSLLFHLNNKAF